MSKLFKKLLVLGVLALTAFPNPGFCGIWETAQQAIARHQGPISYESVVQHLPLLTQDLKEDASGNWVIAGGYIVVSRDGIRSFRNLGDHTRLGAQPEHEFLFAKAPKVGASQIRNNLKNLRVAIDIIPNHGYFKEPIGSMEYSQFVVLLQKTLEKTLEAEGAQVFVIRPNYPSVSATLDVLNANPPHVVIAPQFNADQQDHMVTFCGGNFTPKDLEAEKQRVSFIEAALTGKSLRSAILGAHVMKCCRETFQVNALDSRKATFEGNACAVSVPSMKAAICSQIPLAEVGGELQGIAMRNLVHNGIYTQALVTPFPDMHWVKKQVGVGHEQEWIQRYSKALVQALQSFVAQNPLHD